MTREEAIEILSFYQKGLNNWGMDRIAKAFDMAIEALSAEAVDVVRCKDCKASRVYGKTTQWLACESVMEGQATDPDGYCYFGERREDAEA